MKKTGTLRLSAVARRGEGPSRKAGARALKARQRSGEPDRPADQSAERPRRERTGRDESPRRERDRPAGAGSRSEQRPRRADGERPPRRDGERRPWQEHPAGSEAESRRRRPRRVEDAAPNASAARPWADRGGERGSAPERGDGRRPRDGDRAARGDRPPRSGDRFARVTDRPPRSGERPAPRREADAGQARPWSKSPATRHEPPPAVPAVGIESRLVRVSKLLAERGLCSRREADEYIEKGWVYADGERISQLGSRVLPEAVLTLDARARASRNRLVTILLNKPVGHVSGQPEDNHPPAMALIRPENRADEDAGPDFEPLHLRGLAPAGRLDIDSTGLLIFTQDGTVARQLIGADSTVDKEYLVRVEGDLVDGGLALLNHGLELDGEPLKPARVEWLNDDQLRFVLHEGKKRQIRRMCELVGLRVTGLKRVRIGGVVLGDLPIGQWRYLGPDEGF